VLRGFSELARKVDELDAVILQPAVEESSVAGFVVRGGVIAEPFFLRFGELASQPRSVEQILRAHLEPPAENASESPGSESRISNIDLSDHLSLLARWYYSKPRVGEFFFSEKGWPYRRILRACSRLLAPPPSLPFDSQPPGRIGGTREI
jgi:hypothetical protein